MNKKLLLFLMPTLLGFGITVFAADDLGKTVNLMKAKLVDFEKQGRIKIIKLTENGNKVAEYIERIKSLL